MRQVPYYLIIGSGRVALHFCHYFKLLGIPYHNWSRQNHTVKELLFLNQQCSTVLLLISDSAIKSFVNQYDFLTKKVLVHFSGQLSLANVFGAHPLMTFTRALYDLKTYQSIPFILEENTPEIVEILPGLNNRSFKIPLELKSYYHALCVMSGNFTSILWKKFFKEMESRFLLPKEVLFPYLECITKNLMDDPENSLTGPLIRGDKNTINANLKSLHKDEFKPIYQAFVDVFNNNGGRI